MKKYIYEKAVAKLLFLYSIWRIVFKVDYKFIKGFDNLYLRINHVPENPFKATRWYLYLIYGIPCDMIITQPMNWVMADHFLLGNYHNVNI
jgi:hypothetical protein